MPISLNCPTCGSKLKAPRKAVGRSLRCPKCAGAVLVSAANPVPVAGPPTIETRTNLSAHATRTNQPVQQPVADSMEQEPLPDPSLEQAPSLVKPETVASADRQFAYQGAGFQDEIVDAQEVVEPVIADLVKDKGQEIVEDVVVVGHIAKDPDL